MNAKGKRKLFTTNEKLVQMDITDSITKWKCAEKKKKIAKQNLKFISSLVIEIEDSDSESGCCIDYISSIKERELPFPISCDVKEEDNEVIHSAQKTDSPENIATTPRIFINIGVHKPKPNTSSMHPIACSTPLKSQETSVNNTHVGISDLSNISGNDTRTFTDNDVMSDAESETTIIYNETNNTKQAINIIDHQIFPSKFNETTTSNYSSNTTRPIDKSANSSGISQKEVDNKSTSNSGRKRVAEQGTATKRHKVTLKQQLGPKLLDDRKQTDSSKIVQSPCNDHSPAGCSTPKEACSSTNKKRECTNEEITPKKKRPNYLVEEQKSEQKELPDKDLGKNAKEKENTDALSKTISEKNNEKPPTETNCGNNVEKFKIFESGHSCINKGNTIINSEEKQTNNTTLQSTKGGEMSIQSSKSGASTDKTDAQPSCSSPEKVKAKIEAKKEGKKMNVKYVTLIQELFDPMYKTSHINILPEDDRKAIDMFRNMNTNYQYVCIKLFTWKRNWYNIYKFCDKIGLNIGDHNIHEMYKNFKENRIVDTDFIQDDTRQLLNILELNDLKSIRDKFKLKKTLNNKTDIINALMAWCSTQSTLTSRSAKESLRQEIKLKLGHSVRLNDIFYDTFYRTYILATFTNPAFSKMSDYFKNILHARIAFPEYPLEDYTIFYTSAEFVSYAKARKSKDDLEEFLGKNHFGSLEKCKLIFEELKKTKDDQNDGRYSNTPHLLRFTARAVYVSALSNATATLATKYPTEVKEWLEYMIKNTKFSHRIGEWYEHLSWLYMNYLEPRDYTHAAKLIIEVLQEKKEHLSEVQLHKLGKKGQQLKITKKYKIDQWYHDKIAELVPVPIDIDGFPSITVDASAIRSNIMGQKRNYVIQGKDGEKTVLSVEYIALKHYLEHGYNDGDHCEGALIMATFTLFFWDIIYSASKIVPGSFVSKIQTEPLDMNTQYFYLNRKDAIDRRLEEIEKEWTHPELINFIKDKYEKHSHQSAFCQVDKHIENVELLEILVECIGRTVLAKIYARLVKNVRHYRSGMPDLLVWNVAEKKSKFVEVKGENDKLSVGQTLWLDYLRSIGANIELCKVHSIGSKRKSNEQKAEKKDEKKRNKSSNKVKAEKKGAKKLSKSSSVDSKHIPNVQTKDIELQEPIASTSSSD